MNASTSYDVRVWTAEKRKGTRSTTYRVRWTVGGERFGSPFATARLADSFRSSLLKAARDGEPFDTTTGLPRSMTATQNERLWVDVAREFMERKWDDMSPRHRKSTVEGLVTLTCALLRDHGSPHDDQVLREALTRWHYNMNAPTRAGDPSPQHAEALRWVIANSVPISHLGQPDGVREALRAIGQKLDGSRAAPATFARKRAALSGVLNFAVEKGYLSRNLMRELRTVRRTASDTVDPRVVVNPEQARALLAAVKQIEPPLLAFFALMYYAAPRPAEARNIRRENLELPSTGWGAALFSRGYQESGAAWTDDGKRGEERELKHRDESETRDVPLHPDLVEILRWHLETYGTGTSGRLFVTRTGRGGHPLAAPFQNPVSMSSVYRVWDAAREAALTANQYASPLACRPYDLRHACLSTWLTAGVDSTLVATWAGHSVKVLLTVYARCLDGREELAKERIETLLPSKHGGVLGADSP